MRGQQCISGLSPVSGVVSRTRDDPNQIWSKGSDICQERAYRIVDGLKAEATSLNNWPFLSHHTYQLVLYEFVTICIFVCLYVFDFTMRKVKY